MTIIATLFGICQLTTSPSHDIWVHYWAGRMVLWLDDDDTLNLESIDTWGYLLKDFEVNTTCQNHEMQLSQSSI